MPETDWKIAEASTSESTGNDGSNTEGFENLFEEPKEPWEIKGENSEKDVDISLVPVEDENKCVGELRVLLFEDETMKVEFPKLGRWTLGRLEKAMSPILRACQIELAKELRRSLGQPADFRMSDGDDNG